MLQMSCLATAGFTRKDGDRPVVEHALQQFRLDVFVLLRPNHEIGIWRNRKRSLTKIEMTQIHDLPGKRLLAIQISLAREVSRDNCVGPHLMCKAVDFCWKSILQIVSQQRNWSEFGG